MFGYVSANMAGLSEDARDRYQAVYCGLCRSLKRRHGQVSRLALNYDMAFLIMVLDSLYEPESCQGCKRCLMHPMHAKSYVMSDISDYAADMNVALAYLNLMDNWSDDRNLLSLAGAKLLKKRWLRVQSAYPRQCGAMTRCMDDLRKLEQSGETDPDAGARLFGELLSEVFVYKQDRWEPVLREMAFHLGEFIYIMDAVVDLDRDIKKGRYNPLAALRGEGKTDEHFLELLTVIIGECTIAFEKLPLVENDDIMKNILCSGVWTRYEFEQAKKHRRNGEKRR